MMLWTSLEKMCATTHSLFCFYDISLTSLEVSKDITFQFFSYFYNFKIALNSKSNVNIVTQLGKQKKNLYTFPFLPPITVIIFRLFTP